MQLLQDLKPNSKLLFGILFLSFIFCAINVTMAGEFNAKDSIKETKTSTEIDNNSVNSIKPDMQISPRMMTNMKSDPENDFVQMMIQHKKHAIALSESQISSGNNQATVTLAKKIIDDQNKEIEELQAFMKQQKLSKAAASNKNEAKVTSQKPDMERMNFTMKDNQDVPMSGNQDKDYISSIIQHHEKSIQKTSTYLNRNKTDDIKKMAHQMIDSDKAKIEELKLWQKTHQ